MGRMIDADELRARVAYKRFYSDLDQIDILNFINSAPTVIPDSALAIADCSKLNPDFASILFRPICSRCGRRIVNTEINCIQDEQIELNNMHFRVPSVHVEPSHCPHCNAIFTTIEMPCNVPFTDEIEIKKGGI